MAFCFGASEVHIKAYHQLPWFRKLWDPETAVGKFGWQIKGELKDLIVFKKDDHGTEIRKYISHVLHHIYRVASRNLHRRFQRKSIEEHDDNLGPVIRLDPFECLCCKQTFWEVKGTTLWLPLCFLCTAKMNVPDYMRKSPPNVESEHRVVCTDDSHIIPWACQTHGCVWSIHAQPYFHHVWLSLNQAT